MDREREIEEAVISAFDLDPVYCSKFIFTVKKARSISTSPGQKAKLALDILREFKVPTDVIFMVKTHFNGAIMFPTDISSTGIIAEGRISSGMAVKWCCFDSICP